MHIQSRVWRIYSNIRIYLSQIFIRTFVCINFFNTNIRTFDRAKFDCTNIFGYSFMSVLECNNCSIFEYIRIFVQFSRRIFIRAFVCVKIFNRIYSDIHSCKFFDSNIFGYSFVSKFSRMSHSGVYLSWEPQSTFSQLFLKRKNVFLEKKTSF